MCNSVYHKSDCNPKKPKQFLNGLQMICDEHNIDDITSSDPRVAIVLLRRELENLRKENNLIVERNEILIKSNKHMAQKLKQTEDELKLIKDSEHNGKQELTSYPEEEKIY